MLEYITEFFTNKYLVVGWIGGIMLSICGLPQAIHSLKTKSAQGITWGFLLLWTIGEIFQLIFVLEIKSYPIIFNCLLNLVFCTIISYYKISEMKPKGGSGKSHWETTNWSN